MCVSLDFSDAGARRFTFSAARTNARRERKADPDAVEFGQDALEDRSHDVLRGAPIPAVAILYDGVRLNIYDSGRRPLSDVPLQILSRAGKAVQLIRAADQGQRSLSELSLGDHRLKAVGSGWVD